MPAVVQTYSQVCDRRAGAEPVRISVPIVCKTGLHYTFNQSTANVHYYKQPPTGQKAPPSGHKAEVLSLLQDKSNPEGGAASHKTKGTKKGEKEQPISQFIEGGKGWERGTIKCFCFFIKSEFSGGPFSRTSGVPHPTTNSRKAKPRKKERRGPGTPNTRSDRSHKLSPPTHNVSTPGDPSGQKKRVYT